MATAAEKLDARKAWILLLIRLHPVWQQAGDSQAARTSVGAGSARSSRLVRITDHFEFDPVPVEEIEPPARFVIGMVERFEPDILDHGLGSVEVVDYQPDVVERNAFGIAFARLVVGVERKVFVFIADMDGPSTHLRWPTPALVPAAQIFEQLCAALGIGDCDIGVFELSDWHDYSFYFGPIRSVRITLLAQCAISS